jgi:hypothetical protein
LGASLLMQINCPRISVKRLRLRISDNSNNRMCFRCLDRECESVYKMA